MSKVNLDIAERLDITCRGGDTFELTLTLKDSAGDALPLVTDDYTFLMQVKKNIKAVGPSVLRVPSGGGGEADSDDAIISDGIVVGSSESGVKGLVNFSFLNKDDSGNVTVFLSAEDMRKVAPGRYKYDLQYNVGTTQKTILEGSFRVNSDVSKSI
jgi:hypothetical protein